MDKRAYLELPEQEKRVRFEACIGRPFRARKEHGTTATTVETP
jgi:hypothetical protein